MSIYIERKDTINATKFVSDLTSEEIVELYELKENGHSDRVRTRAMLFS